VGLSACIWSLRDFTRLSGLLATLGRLHSFQDLHDDASSK